jgi:predicted nucleic acid-binding protein
MFWGATVIADSSALICFAVVDRFDLLAAAFHSLLITPGVEGELARRSERWRGLAHVLEFRGPFSRVELPGEVSEAAKGLEVDFGKGETESIALAVHLGLPLLMDDLRARQHAESLGVKVIGTLKVLALCKERRLIPEARPLVERMRAGGRFFRESFAEAFLRSIGEG